MANEIIKTETGYIQETGALDFLEEQMGGLELELDKISIPSGGSIMFEMPGLGDEPDYVKEFNGVILAHHKKRAMFKGKYTGSGDSPICSSVDGKTGTYNINEDGEILEFPEERNCDSCPYNKFEEDENGVMTKKCKQKHEMFILREGEILPVVLNAPTGSIKNIMTYLSKITSRKYNVTHIVTKFKLIKASSSKNIEYAQLLPTFVRALEPEEIETIEQLKKGLAPIIKK